ncbi:MAG: hypothetical protein ACRDVG_07085 [Jatrophihabitantaceae bacterium]
MTGFEPARRPEATQTGLAPAVAAAVAVASAGGAAVARAPREAAGSVAHNPATNTTINIATRHRKPALDTAKSAMMPSTARATTGEDPRRREQARSTTPEIDLTRTTRELVEGRRLGEPITASVRLGAVGRMQFVAPQRK